MQKVNTLLICDDIPTTHYGTGQRLLAIKRALETLGECRVLLLTDGDRPAELSPQDFIAPRPIANTTTKLGYILRNLTFYIFRKNPIYDAPIAQIKNEFNFDVAVCSFFRNTPAAPTQLTPCLLDIDAIDEPKGLLTKLIWPLTKMMMRLRARDFKKVFVIRKQDFGLFEKICASDIVFLPGFSASATPRTTSARNKCVLAVGAMKWQPNRDAIDMLVAAGLPPMLAAKGWSLRLIGSGTDVFKEVHGISCGGFVEDINDEYAEAGLVVCPIWSGSGANIKLAEAIQSGCAVVATGHSAAAYEGFLIPDKHFLVGHDMQAFVAQILRAVDDTELRAALESSAKAFSQTHLTQTQFTKIVTGAVHQALK